MTASISAIIVGYDGDPNVLKEAVRSLHEQTERPAQIICVDQSPDGRFARFFAETADVEVLALAENLGYPSACNRAAELATGEALLFINPDATAEPGCLEELSAALTLHPEVAIAGAQVLLPGGDTVNAGDNVLHLSGLSWAGRYGRAAEDGPPRQAAVVSGAALLVRAGAFAEVGGYTEGFFMYYDDVDLAWRARLLGWEVLFCPRARVVHDYEFAKGTYKWRYLERNRWWCLLAHFELRTLLVLAPLLVAVEGAIWLRALNEGWLRAKLGAWRLLWSSRRALRSRRRRIQSTRKMNDRAIIERMSAAVDSPFLASPLLRRIGPVLALYRRAVLAVTS